MRWIDYFIKNKIKKDRLRMFNWLVVGSLFYSKRMEVVVEM